jgi:Domain of Unknown Function (DUF349)
MSFLDRFKIQPRYKSTDPEQRVAGVQELTDTPEDAAVLVSLARDDADARVRRAAIARIQDANILADLAAGDPDATIRAELIERLAGIAMSADSAAAALRALAALSDPKQIGTVAKASPLEAVRVEAVGRLSDVKTLSSVARHAADGRVAVLATERVQDAAELLNIAVKTDHKDAGIGALERAAALGAADRATLEGIADRAKNKSVGKRARAMVQAIDEQEAARKAALERHQQRIAGFIARAEGLSASTTAPDTEARIAALEAEWSAFESSEADPIAASDRARFSAAVSAARAILEREAQERAERDARQAELAAARASKERLCEHVEQLNGDDALDRLEQARAEWEGLPADPEAAAHERFLARFEQACGRARERHENRQQTAHVNARLDELSREAEQLAAQEDSPAYAWDSISREWKSLKEKSEGLDEAIEQRYTAAAATIHERAEAKKAAAEKALRQQVQRIDQLIERVHRRAEAEDLTLKEAEKAARDLRSAIETPLTLPHHEREYLVERLKAALAALAPKLHELREMDEWKRFANAAVQEELIAQAEGLSKKYDLEKPEDIEKAARELHEIQERWKTAAEAPKAQAQTLWHRYRQAADPIQTKAREFFAARAVEREANLKAKLALCERAEALAESTDWIKTADELKKLQAEWQTTGPVPRADTRLVWKRFRDACDKFFTRRNEDLAQRKEVWSANQARKEALCARAEALAESRDWEKAAAELRRLQAEWKTIGPVRRSKSEVLWQRFRAAADRFFDRYKRRDEIEIEMRQADREALAQELEALLPPAAEAVAGEAALPSEPRSEAPADLLDKVRSLRTRWNQSTSAVRAGADPLSMRFVNAMERLLTTYPDAFKGTELDIDASRQRMEKLVARVEGFVSESDVRPDSTQDLAARLREALASNTIGGRAGEESKWRSMADEVRQAQSSFARLVPVPGEQGRQLADRFHKACNRFYDQYRRRVPQNSGVPSRGPRPVGAR